MEKSYILFTIADEKYAIDLKYIQEVSQLDEFIEVSYLDRSFKITLNQKGHKVSMIDLRAILGLEISASDNLEVLLVQKKGYEVGLIIDKTLQIQSFEEDLLTNNASLKETPKEFIKNVICLKAQEIVVLDIDRIIEKTLKC